VINIIAHRGYWKSKDEQNTRIAFERAFDNNFGVETDLRDICGEIVISHNMPKGNEITFDEVLQILDGRNLTLALNIKADGLGEKISDTLNKYSHKNYFTFDMSVPDMVVQSKLGLRFFTGKSDIINPPIMYREASGIWLDSFYSDWFSESDISSIMSDKKAICIVSPELHHREHSKIWQKYKGIKDIMLCTDYPQEAREFFNE